MKLKFALLFALAGLPLIAAEDLSKSIEALRSVKKEGQGNEAAGKAWREIVKADAMALPQVLKGMNGANPLAENWLNAPMDFTTDALAASLRAGLLADAKLQDTDLVADPMPALKNVEMFNVA